MASTTNGHRERRAWTEEEDRMLLEAIAAEDPGAHPPSKWHAIATRVQGRTNKDCRKRWWAQMAGAVSKGAWSVDEDQKLNEAVSELGQKWALVAQRVGTRNSGQCAKRWTDALDPLINRQEWTDEEDVKLLEAVQMGGKQWATIVRTHLHGRTGLAAKNRYNHLIRTSGDRGSGRERRKQQTAPYPQPTVAAPLAPTPPNQLPSGQPPLSAPPLPGLPEHPGLLENPNMDQKGHIISVADYERARHMAGGPGIPPPGVMPFPPNGGPLGLELPPLRLPQQPSPISGPPSAIMQIDPQLQHHHPHHAQMTATGLPPPTGPLGPQGPQLGNSREQSPNTPSVAQTHSAYEQHIQWTPWSHVS